MEHLRNQQCAHCVAWARAGYDSVRQGNYADDRQFFSRWLAYFVAVLGG